MIKAEIEAVKEEVSKELAGIKEDPEKVAKLLKVLFEDQEEVYVLQ